MVHIYHILFGCQMFGSAGLAYATAALTVTTLFFGELLPKAMGVNNAEVVARRILPVIIVLSVVLNPVAESFTLISKVGLFLFPFSPFFCGFCSISFSFFFFRCLETRMAVFFFNASAVVDRRCCCYAMPCNQWLPVVNAPMHAWLAIVTANSTNGCRSPLLQCCNALPIAADAMQFNAMVVDCHCC